MKAIQLSGFLSILLSILMTLNTAGQNVEIILGVEKNQFLLGEPVVLLVSVTNRDRAEINLPPELGPESDFLTYVISDPDGKEIAFSPLFVADYADYKTLGRNETARGTARIFYGGNGYTFTRPGRYNVTARFGDSRSGPVTFQVLQPRTDAEREQARIVLDHPEVGLFLMLEGGDELEDALNQFDTLLRDHPGSLITQYARYAMAKNYSVPARNFVSQKPRNADLPRTVEILRETKIEEMQFYYRTKAVETLATALQRLERRDEARNVLEEFSRNLEQRENLRPYFLPRIEEKIRELR
jgi:hypothetical protein